MRVITQAEFALFETDNLRLMRKSNAILEKILDTEERIKKILDGIKIKISEL